MCPGKPQSSKEIVTVDIRYDRILVNHSIKNQKRKQKHYVTPDKATSIETESNYSSLKKKCTQTRRMSVMSRINLVVNSADLRHSPCVTRKPEVTQKYDTEACNQAMFA